MSLTSPFFRFLEPYTITRKPFFFLYRCLLFKKYYAYKMYYAQKQHKINIRLKKKKKNGFDLK